MDALGGLFALILFGCVFVVGGLLITSHGVLISEAPLTSGWGGFTCTYFTGTRSVEIFNSSTTGCPRFVKVGE